MTETAPLVTPRPPARRSLGWAFAAVAVVGAAAVWSSSGAPFDATVTESLETATDDIGSQDSSSNAPHILLVTLDDAGWNDLGYQSEDLSCSAEDEGSHCSNHSYSVTPHMDSLAEAGVKLTGLYGQPSCSPSRAALLTGKWVHKIGFQDLEVEYYSNFSVPLQHTLLPQRLRVAAGYRTYGIGKWNIGHCNAQYLPWARGFDYFLGYFSGGKTYTTHEVRLALARPPSRLCAARHLRAASRRAPSKCAAKPVSCATLKCTTWWRDGTWATPPPRNRRCR